MEIAPELAIPDMSKSIMDGAVVLYGKIDLGWRSQQIAAVGKKYGFDLFTPLNKFTKKQWNVLLYGTPEAIQGQWSTGQEMNMKQGWEGIIPQNMRLYEQTDSEYRKDFIQKFMVAKPCTVCAGKRLKDSVLAVHI